MTMETTIWWQDWASSFPGQLNPNGFLLDWDHGGTGKSLGRTAKKLAVKDMRPESIMGILKATDWRWPGKRWQQTRPPARPAAWGESESDGEERKEKELVTQSTKE